MKGHIYVEVEVAPLSDPMGRAREFITSAFYHPLNARVVKLVRGNKNSVTIIENTTGVSDGDATAILERKLSAAITDIPHAARPR